MPLVLVIAQHLDHGLESEPLGDLLAGAQAAAELLPMMNEAAVRIQSHNDGKPAMGAEVTDVRT
jgi:hypothetical protein